MSLPDGAILITGAAGFLGASAARGLAAAGYEVIATDRDGVEGTLPLDVTDPEAVRKAIVRFRPAAVVHAAAVSGPMLMADAPREVWRINVDGTVNLVDALRTTQMARVILLSSTDVYGPVLGEVSEATAVAPDTVYAASKVAAEAALAGYARFYGLPGVALRLSWVVGMGRRTPTALSGWVKDAVAGRTIARPENPSGAAPYLHVDDAIDAVVAALRVPADTFRTYNTVPSRLKTRIAFARNVADRFGVGLEDVPDIGDICRSFYLRSELADQELSWQARRDPLDAITVSPSH